jgi:PAS domain-containing protein
VAFRFARRCFFVAARAASGAPHLFEGRLRRHDGEYRWHAVRRVPLRDERGDIVKWYAVGFDIADKKAVEDALRRSEADLARAERELRHTLDTIPTLAWRARPDGFAEYLNKPWLDYTGLTLPASLVVKKLSKRRITCSASILGPLSSTEQRRVV